MILGERLRNPEDRAIVVEVLQRVLKAKVWIGSAPPLQHDPPHHHAHSHTHVHCLSMRAKGLSALLREPKVWTSPPNQNLCSTLTQPHHAAEQH
jgi:hypothetical protein